MADSLRNKHFVARLRDDLFSVDDEPEPPIHHGHQLVRHMDEIIPLSAGWIGKHIAGVAAPAPVVGDQITVEGNRKFLAGEVGHEVKYGV